MTSQRVEILDVFRGIAILMVVLFHFTARLPPASLNITGMPSPPVFFGWIGVYFFFAISGYCIFLTLERSATVSMFLARRFSRIYPAYLAAAILLFLYGLVAYLPSVPSAEYRVNTPGIIDLFINFFFVGEIGEWVNGSFWSIAVEVKFYLLVALLALLFADHKKLATVFSWLALILAPLWIIADQAGYLLKGSHDIGKLIAFLAIAPYLPFFAIGILGRMRMQAKMPTTVLLAANIVMSAVIILLQATATAGMGETLTGTISVLTFLGLMALFLRFVNGQALPHIPVLSPALAGIGFFSFSWYLIHENLGISFLVNLDRYMPAPLAAILAMIATFIIAYAFAQAFEWRFRKPFEKFA
ncbi:MAG TPA: acyltransferase, partial [Arsenicitalea sp.]|nr:acyltransferase [Arsenicitalea sp.]